MLPGARGKQAFGMGVAMTTRELLATAIGLGLWDRCHRGCGTRRSVFATMTLKIERIAAEHTTFIRLIGRLQREHLSMVAKQIQSSTGEVTLDLAELALVSVEGIRFLNSCEDEGIVVANASPYVTDWMKRERLPPDDDLC